MMFLKIITKIKIVVIIILNTFVFYSIVCFISQFLVNDLKKKIKDLNPNNNLIRATYPNYKNFSKNKARKIFEEYSAPGSKYQSFTGYRRNMFSGEVVNVDDNGFRISINHQIDNSVWFLGGSTMWGTGSDDINTIPSVFAKITNEPVLNLGESGYNSFQEVIQLQILLANKHKPKMVIFYDGMNDGGTFCKKNKFPQLQHAYTSRYDKMIRENRDLRKKIKNKKILDLDYFFTKIRSFYLMPLNYFETLEKHNEAIRKKSSSNKITSIKKNKNYMFCDDKEYAKKAAELTISSWLNAYLILQEKGIPVRFILQPTASYHPNKYKLDHIIDFKKQAIINEKESFIGYYEALKKQWSLKCKKFNICNLFLDLSKVFFNLNEEIFIDQVHISPNGNKIIATKIAESLIN